MHTPTPWEVSKGRDNEKDGLAEVWGSIVGGDWYVARIWADVKGSEKMAEANAGLIVRAVNSHDDLLAALKVLLASASYSTEAMDDAEEQARAAIAKAEATS